MTLIHFGIAAAMVSSFFVALSLAFNETNAEDGPPIFGVTVPEGYRTGLLLVDLCWRMSNTL